MDLVIFEHNKPLVLEAFGNGEFDYVESASEVFETEFFRFIKAKTILNKLAETDPAPRKKQEVPLCFYVAINLSMRLHDVHSFNGFPLVVRSGGLLNVLGPEGARKVTHPDNGDVTIACEGFNQENHYDREALCDQDFLRKLAKDTEADASYLFVPDNPNYEGPVKLLFDERKTRCQWRRCYKMVSLLHTNRPMDFFIFVSLRGSPWQCP